MQAPEHKREPIKRQLGCSLLILSMLVSVACEKKPPAQTETTEPTEAATIVATTTPSSDPHRIEVDWGFVASRKATAWNTKDASVIENIREMTLDEHMLEAAHVRAVTSCTSGKVEIASCYERALRQNIKLMEFSRVLFEGMSRQDAVRTFLLLESPFIWELLSGLSSSSSTREELDEKKEEVAMLPGVLFLTSAFALARAQVEKKTLEELYVRGAKLGCANMYPSSLQDHCVDQQRYAVRERFARKQLITKNCAKDIPDDPALNLVCLRYTAAWNLLKADSISRTLLRDGVPIELEEGEHLDPADIQPGHLSLLAEAAPILASTRERFDAFVSDNVGKTAAVTKSQWISTNLLKDPFEGKLLFLTSKEQSEEMTKDPTQSMWPTEAEVKRLPRGKRTEGELVAHAVNWREGYAPAKGSRLFAFFCHEVVFATLTRVDDCIAFDSQMNDANR